MKALIFVAIAISVFSCKQEKKINQRERASDPHFEWLTGDWFRINEQEGRQTYEIWSKKNEIEFAGFSYTLQNLDTIWQERIRLAKTDTGWTYEVTGKATPGPTVFRLTKIEENGFICENPENDFPVRIRYFAEGDKMTAIISGESREIPFEFEKVK